MPTYTHDYQSISEEPVECEIDYIGGTDKNYAKTRAAISTLTKVVQAGINITVECSIETLAGIGNVITFGNPSTNLGLVIVKYIATNGQTIVDEGIDITRYNEGGTTNNKLTTQEFPVKQGSITILDGEGTDVSSYLTGIEGDGLEILRVNDLAPATYSVSYQYDAGEAGSIWVDNYNYNNDIIKLENYIDESDGKYEERLKETLGEKEVARKNLELYLKRAVLNAISSYTEEKTLTETVKTYWDTNKGDYTWWDWSEFQDLRDHTQNLKNRQNANDSNGLTIKHDITTSKIPSYIASLSQLLDEETTFNFDSSSRRYDYNGSGGSAVISGLNKLTDGIVLAANSYSESVNYSMRVDFGGFYLITKIKLYIVPSDINILDIDDILSHLIYAGNPTIVTPANFNDDSDFDLQINNIGLKNIVKVEAHNQWLTKEIDEAEKDENGAPISKDSDGNPFEKKVIYGRSSLVLFKKSNMITNYTAEVQLSKVNSNDQPLMELICNLGYRQYVNEGVTTFLTDWNRDTGDPEGASRIWAWRGDNSYGVHYVTGDVGPQGGGPSYVFIDSGFPDTSDKSDAWDFVKADIEKLLGVYFQCPVNGVPRIAIWLSEVNGEGIPTDAKVVESRRKMWEDKFEDANQQYLGILNSKNSKQTEKIEKEKILDNYTPLPPIT